MLKLFSLRHWDTYCLLAIASITWLIITSIRTHRSLTAVHHPRATAATLMQLPALERSSEPAWVKRHELIVKRAQSTDYDVMLLGDSITQGWDYQPDAWQAHLPEIRTLNAGIASDRVEHILWRVRHGLFSTAKPKAVVLMAGINNLAITSPQEIAGGLSQIITAIHQRSPSTQILLCGILPSGESANHPRRAKILRVNKLLAKLSDGQYTHYQDAGSRFLNLDGSFTRSISSDGVHLTHQGYAIWAKSLHSKLPRLLGRISH